MKYTISFDKITLPYRRVIFLRYLDIMSLLHHIIICYGLLLNVCYSNTQTYQRVYERRSGNDAYNQAIKALKSIINDKQDGRRFDSSEYKKKYLLQTMKLDMSKKDFNRLLRQQVAEADEGPVAQDKDAIADLVERELKYALAKKHSALYDRAVVQKKGKQDFLVINAGDADPFVTVIPNDIYYNHEKSCVNWLEDCNVQGIRSRLLQKIKSPYV